VAIENARRERLLIEVAQGHNLREAAKRSGVSERTARRIVKDPVYNETLADLRKHLIEGLRDELLESSHEALSKMRELVHSEDERIAFMASKEILSHVLPARLQLDVGATSRHPSGLSDDDLNELFCRLGNSGMLREDQMETYRSYVEAISRAENDPDYPNVVPSGFMTAATEQTRLEAWRRSWCREKYPELPGLKLSMLRLVKSVLAEQPEHANVFPGD
jgi:hypothetical protein